MRRIPSSDDEDPPRRRPPSDETSPVAEGGVTNPDEPGQAQREAREVTSGGSDRAEHVAQGTGEAESFDAFVRQYARAAVGGGAHRGITESVRASPAVPGVREERRTQRAPPETGADAAAGPADPDGALHRRVRPRASSSESDGPADIPPATAPEDDVDLLLARVALAMEGAGQPEPPDAVPPQPRLGVPAAPAAVPQPAPAVPPAPAAVPAPAPAPDRFLPPALHRHATQFFQTTPNSSTLREYLHRILNEIHKFIHTWFIPVALRMPQPTAPFTYSYLFDTVYLSHRGLSFLLGFVVFISVGLAVAGAMAPFVVRGALALFNVGVGLLAWRAASGYHNWSGDSPQAREWRLKTGRAYTDRDASRVSLVFCLAWVLPFAAWYRVEFFFAVFSFRNIGSGVLTFTSVEDGLISIIEMLVLSLSYEVIVGVMTLIVENFLILSLGKLGVKIARVVDHASLLLLRCCAKTLLLWFPLLWSSIPGGEGRMTGYIQIAALGVVVVAKCVVAMHAFWQLLAIFRLRGKHKYGELVADTDGQCPICQEEYAQHHLKKRELPCGHTFCNGCIKHWLKRENRRTCPVCRREYDFWKPKHATFGVNFL